METMRSRRNLCGQVVHDLGCQILAGKVKPGEPLPQEAVLCDKMGVSRTVIREAIKSLAAKGLVDSRAKRGTIVLPARSWNYLDPEVLDWQSRADTSDSQLFFLTEFRQAIEPAAAALAAERATDEQLQLIRDAFERMEQHTDSVEEFLQADLEFHSEILHAAGNLFFSPVANVIHVSLASSLRVTNRQASDNRTSIPPHRKVLDAISDRDPEAAREAMRSLLDDADARIKKATKAASK